MEIAKEKMELTINAENELVPAAKQLLVVHPDARVFAFYGSMGAGKTTFIKAICRELGVDDLVQSPSFAIIHEYKNTAGRSLYHFDFYRIKKTTEVFDLGYEDYFYSGDYCFIEWPELIEDLLPENVTRIWIETGSEESVRTIRF